jgi:hypothetical protein
MRKYVLLGILILFAALAQANASDNAAWKDNVTDISTPSIPAQGMANGVEFKVEKASLENGILELRQGKEFFPDQAFTIFLFLKKGEPLEGKKFIMKPEVMGGVHVHLKYKVAGKSISETKMFVQGYAMKLEFGQKTGNSIQGTIYLCLPDKEKSFVAGTFEAEVK